MKKIIGRVLAIALLLLPYLCWMFLAVLMQVFDVMPSGRTTLLPNGGETDLMFVALIIFYAVIVLANVIWLVYRTTDNGAAREFLFWDMLIKLCYIPAFVLMGVCILMGIATFLMGGIVMVAFGVLIDLMLLIPPSIYGVCGCIRAAKEGKMSAAFAVIMAILHFFFFVDVIAAIVVYCTVRSGKKEQQFVR